MASGTPPSAARRSPSSSGVRADTDQRAIASAIVRSRSDLSLHVESEIDVDSPAWGETVTQSGRVADVIIDRSKTGEVRGLAVAIARHIVYLARQCPPR